MRRKHELPIISSSNFLSPSRKRASLPPTSKLHAPKGKTWPLSTSILNRLGSLHRGIALKVIPLRITSLRLALRSMVEVLLMAALSIEDIGLPLVRIRVIIITVLHMVRGELIEVMRWRRVVILRLIRILMLPLWWSSRPTIGKLLMPTVTWRALLLLRFLRTAIEELMSAITLRGTTLLLLPVSVSLVALGLLRLAVLVPWPVVEFLEALIWLRRMAIVVLPAIGLKITGGLRFRALSIL